MCCGYGGLFRREFVQLDKISVTVPMSCILQHAIMSMQVIAEKDDRDNRSLT